MEKKNNGFMVFLFKNGEKPVVPVFAQKLWKPIGFIVFSFKHGEKPLVLLRFCSNMVKNHGFYCKTNFGQRIWPLGLSYSRGEKALVLLGLQSRMLKSIGFIVKIKKMKKPLVFIWKIAKKVNFVYKTNVKPKKDRKTNFGQRIWPLGLSYSGDELWGTLSAKLFRELQQSTKKIVQIHKNTKTKKIY